jgi:hypothetical protein
MSLKIQMVKASGAALYEGLWGGNELFPKSSRPTTPGAWRLVSRAIRRTPLPARRSPLMRRLGSAREPRLRNPAHNCN